LDRHYTYSNQALDTTFLFKLCRNVTPSPGVGSDSAQATPFPFVLPSVRHPQVKRLDPLHIYESIIRPILPRMAGPADDYTTAHRPMRRLAIRPGGNRRIGTERPLSKESELASSTSIRPFADY